MRASEYIFLWQERGGGCTSENLCVMGELLGRRFAYGRRQYEIRNFGISYLTHPALPEKFPSTDHHPVAPTTHPHFFLFFSFFFFIAIFSTIIYYLLPHVLLPSLTHISQTITLSLVPPCHSLGGCALSSPLWLPLITVKSGRVAEIPVDLFLFAVSVSLIGRTAEDSCLRFS
ncbi:hypothetical protein HOY80DRAFT_189383 [Tuber brumale]|nr:hypothetical protein HOY80DRAFT_189383 [Tuber brumale]